MVSAVIITRNEEAHITKCISALHNVTDDIIVVDSGSSDNTIEIVNSLGVRVFHKKWEGYGANKNFGTSKAQHDWILSVDGDEVLSDDLIHSLNNLELQQNHIYQLNSLVNYGGKWIRHCGWYPKWKNRLYNKNECNWTLDPVHEDLFPLTKKKKVQVPGDIWHYSYASYKDHKIKADVYAKLKAQLWIEEKTRPSYHKRYFGSAFAFLKTFILNLGILDGMEGWKISKVNAFLSSQQIKYYDQIVKRSKP